MTRLDRRQLLGMAAALPLAALAGCATNVGGYSLDEAVRRLMMLSTQRAFARLVQPGGFYDDQLTRIDPAESLDRGAKGMLGAVLRTNAVRRRIAIALNRLAEEAARRATPIVLDAIRDMRFADALAVLRGGPTAATALLETQTRGAIVDAMYPEIARLLESDLVEVVSAAIAVRTGVDYAVLAHDAAGQAGYAIFRAIGREEAAIRADPRSTRDPALIALLDPRR